MNAAAWAAELARRRGIVPVALSPAIPLTCDACGHFARTPVGVPCPECLAYYGSANDSAVGRMSDATQRAVCPHCRHAVRVASDPRKLVPHDLDGLEANDPGYWDGANPEGVGHVRCEGRWAPVR